jgi:hypothetical protein
MLFLFLIIVLLELRKDFLIVFKDRISRRMAYPVPDLYLDTQRFSLNIL